MLRRCVLGFAAMGVLVALATGAMAAALTVDSALAVQYDHGVFSAAVLAHGPTQMADAHLLVNDVAVVPDRTNQTVLRRATNLTLFTLTAFTSGDVVHPGDVVTAVVTDISGTTVEKSVTCSAGRFLHQLVVCR